MQRIVDRSEAKPRRKRCPQMVAIWIEISISEAGSGGLEGRRYIQLATIHSLLIQIHGIIRCLFRIHLLTRFQFKWYNDRNEITIWEAFHHAKAIPQRRVDAGCDRG